MHQTLHEVLHQRVEGSVVFVSTLVCALLVAFAPAAGAQDGGGWIAPVRGEVIDGFRPPVHIGAPGNRGWEYRTQPGAVVVASGPGVVAFAGPIAGRLYVSIDHVGGLRTTYSFLAAVDVQAGVSVGAGDRLGTAGERLHFGVRQGSTYLDPAGLFASRSSTPSTSATSVRLVPLGPADTALLYR